MTAAIITLLYIAAFAGFLRSAAYAILIGGWIGLALAVWPIRRSSRQTVAEFATPGLVVFLVAAALLWMNVRSASYAHWDEFSHWGLVTKTIVADAALPRVDTAVYLPGYPPGSALWHYFVTRIVPYSEGSVYFAHHLLVLVALVLPLGSLGWRRWPTVLATIVFGYFAAFTFGHGFQSLLIEPVLAASFGGAVLWYVLGDGSRARLVAMAPIVFTLPLWKEGGLLLAGIACAVPGVVEAVRFVRARRAIVSGERPRRAFAGLVLALIVVPAAAILADVSWEGHVRRNFPTYQSKTSTITWPHISQTLSSQRTERDRVVLEKFRDAFFAGSVGNARFGALANGVFEHAGLFPLVPNGDFSTRNLQGWRPFGTSELTVRRGRLRVSRNAGPDTAAQAIAIIRTEPGQRYSVSCTYDLVETQSATLRVRSRATTLSEVTSTEPSGRLSTSFTAIAFDTEIDLWVVSPRSHGYGFFDDVRVTEAGEEGPRLLARALARLPPVRMFVERPAPPVLWAAVLAALGVALWPMAATGATRVVATATSVCFTAGAVVYGLALLIVYLYGLSEIDARDLTSYGRYTGTYFFGWALVVFGTAIYVSVGRRRRSATAVAALLTLLTLAAAPRASADWLLDDQHLLPQRAKIRAQLEQIDKHVPFDRSVSILWQPSQGFEFWILRYELAPRITNQWHFAFGPPYYPGDVWTSDYPAEQFLDTISTFDYLLIGQADGLFWSRYGHLFEPAARGLDAGLFKIERGLSGGVSLQMVTAL